MMTESDFVDTRTDLDAAYPCPDVECDGVVKYETTGYWQCSECSFWAKHVVKTGQSSKVGDCEG